jgi:hypothetical protein
MLSTTYQQIRKAGNDAAKNVTIKNKKGESLEFKSHLDMVNHFKSKGFIVQRGREVVEWDTTIDDVRSGTPASGTAYQEIIITERF